MPLMEGDLGVSLPGLKADERLRVLHGAFLGLQALHAASLLHFDIKLTNLLIDAQATAHAPLNSSCPAQYLH